MSDNLRRATSALRDGQFVVVSDATDRENEADLILAPSTRAPSASRS